MNASAANLLRNAVSQIGGRLALSLGRLGLALLIVRAAGAERYGEYALVINFVTLFEWLVDFGQTDIAVRDLCQRPADAASILRALGGLKLVMGAALTLALPALLALLAYPPSVIAAGAVGAAGLLFYAFVQPFRVVFRARMVMARDVGAEVAGLAVMVPLTWSACRAHAGTATLVGCYALSRIVFLAVVVALGRAALPAGSLALSAARHADRFALARRAGPLGAAGLLVVVYDSLAVVMLSKLTDLAGVAQYAAATRYVFPVIIIVQSLNSAFYPPLSAAFRAAPARFAALQRAALMLSVFVGGGIFAGIHAAAPALMALMGPAIAPASDVLRLMAWVVLARSVTTAMSPLIVIAGRQGRVLWITASAILLQLAALAVLVPRFGLIGAAAGFLGIEVALGVIPVWIIGTRATGLAVGVATPAKLIACAAVAAIAADLSPLAGGIGAGLLAGLLYLALVFGTGAIGVSETREALGAALRRNRVSAERSEASPDEATGATAT